MQRREAIQVLREICKCIPDESTVSCVFLEQIKNSDDSKWMEYELHIKMRVDKTTQEIIESVTRKNGLWLSVSNGDFVVSALKAPMEIVA